MSTYTTKSIDELPVASELQDGCSLPVCQDGTAKRLTGAQLKAYAEAAAQAQVKGMSVEAKTLETGAAATVENTTDANGATKLIFGLPTGPVGPAGPTGPAGKGLLISGRYGATDEVPDPQEGESYYIGTTAPYDVCTYANGEWINNGPITWYSDDAITAISVTEDADGTVTMVNTWKSGATETIVIIPDAEGNPDKLTYNGKDIDISWVVNT